ncbi:hypothetical protein [Antrihabitans spumae]|uniref:Uncharacterized protein n=1 Tax=Antrihabitans spumae TaxID=3373370 RepID=A0ABW7KAL4_9NOCA
MAHESIRRHPLHAAQRVAALARIGFWHPRSRSRVLEFDRHDNSDDLISSLQAARGMPLLLSDQLLLLGGNPSARGRFGPTNKPTLVGGRLSTPRPIDADRHEITSTTAVDPGIGIDSRIAEKVLQHVGFLAPSEQFLATSILQQAVQDVAVDSDRKAGERAIRAVAMLDSTHAARATVATTAAGDPVYHLPSRSASWNPTTARVLARAWLGLLVEHGTVLRHLTQRTVAPSGDEVWFSCLDSVRRLPATAVDAGLSLIDAAAGDDEAMARLVDHLHAVSDGADTAATYAGAARRVVARTGADLAQLVPKTSPTTVDDVPPIHEPFATCLVIGQAVYISRVLTTSTGHPPEGSSG